MPEMQQIPDEHPLKVAYDKYAQTDDYKNSFRWAAEEQHRNGSMWAAFMAGWNAGCNHAYQDRAYDDLAASNISTIRDIHENSMRLIKRIIDESLGAHPHYEESYPEVLKMVEMAEESRREAERVDRR